jgi:hypothetical protein
MEDIRAKSTDKKTCLKRYLAQSQYITVAWNSMRVPGRCVRMGMCS